MSLRFSVLLVLAVVVTVASAEQLQAQLFRRGCCNNRVQAPRACCQPVAPQATCCAGTTMAAPMMQAAPSVVYSPAPAQMAPAPMISYGPTPVYNSLNNGCCGQNNISWPTTPGPNPTPFPNPTPVYGCPDGQVKDINGNCVASSVTPPASPCGFGEQQLPNGECVCRPGFVRDTDLVCRNSDPETCETAYTACVGNCGNCSGAQQTACNNYCQCVKNNCNGSSQLCGREPRCVPSN